MAWWVVAAKIAGSILVSELLRPKPKIEDARPKGLGDFNFPTTSERRKIPVVWGTRQLKAPNITWYGDFVADPQSESQKTGLFSSQDVVLGHQYSVGAQLALCRGEDVELRRIWANDKLLAEPMLTANGTVDVEEPYFHSRGEVTSSSGVDGIVGVFDFHDGSRSQSADSYLAAFQTSALVAYRGTAYVTWRGPSSGSRVLLANQVSGTKISKFNGKILTFKEGYVGNTTQMPTLKFELRRIPNGLGLTGGKEIVAGGVNPANWFYEALTDQEWGAGRPPSEVDLTNFAAVADTLYTEGHGFSYVWDSTRELEEIRKEVERQIDGRLLFNRNVGLWQIVLARGGYTVGSLPALDETNCEVEQWDKGSWDATVNQVNVEYDTYDTDAEDWKETSVPAMDGSNFLARGSEFEYADESFPGVTDGPQAKSIAWRELRGRDRPLGSGILLLDRSFHDVQENDLFRFSWGADLNYVDLPVRVAKVDLGTLADPRIRVFVTEDAFEFEAGSSADPPNSGWDPPVDDLGAIPVNESAVFEAPAAFTRRDLALTDVLDRIWYGGRNQGDGASGVKAVQRNAAGTPSGSYAFDVQASEFVLVGELNAALAADTQNPTTATTEDVRVDPSPDSVSALFSFFDAAATVGDLGNSLVNLILVDQEFMLVTSAIDQTTYVDLVSVYRGALDSAVAKHATGAKVYLLRGALGPTVIPQGNNVHAQLRPTSSTDEVTEGEANLLTLTMADRGRSPYPPNEPEVNGTRYPEVGVDTVSLDATTDQGSGLDDVGFDVDFTRRDRRIFDEVTSILNDGSAVNADFPGAESTVFRMDVYDDPLGSPALLFTTAYNAGGAALTATRTEILANTDGVVPSQMSAEVQSRHTVGGTDYASLQKLVVEFDSDSSVLSGLDNTGARAQNVTSASFTADVTDTYTFELGTDLLTSGALEVQLNGGGFSTVISSGGGTSGTIAVTAGDTVEWRHTQSGSGDTYTHLRIHHSGTDEAYGILIV